MRKRNHRMAPKRPSVSPVLVAVVRANIQRDIDRIRLKAGIHSFAGNDAAVLCNEAGRLVFIVCHAAAAHGLHDCAEVSILRGTAESLGDLQEDHANLERLRASIQSGLSAADRLLPQLDKFALALAALELDELLKTDNLGTSHIREMVAA